MVRNGQRVTLILTKTADRWLSGQTAAIRKGSGYLANRSAIARAVLEGVAGSELDLSQCASEDQIRGLVEFLLQAFTSRVCT